MVLKTTSLYISLHAGFVYCSDPCIMVIIFIIITLRNNTAKIHFVVSIFSTTDFHKKNNTKRYNL